MDCSGKQKLKVRQAHWPRNKTYVALTVSPGGGGGVGGVLLFTAPDVTHYTDGPPVQQLGPAAATGASAGHRADSLTGRLQTGNLKSLQRRPWSNCR